MDRILPRLYLGNWLDAYDEPQLAAAGVTHVLNCAREVGCPFRRQFRYLHLKFLDPDPDFSDYVPQIVRFIHRGRRTGGVLVHCRAGMSRSPTAILAYLCWRKKWSVEAALDFVARKSDVYPDGHLLEQLRTFFEEE